MNAKTQQCLAPETQEKRAIRLEKNSSQKKKLLSSEATILERASRLGQVSAQKSKVLAYHCANAQPSITSKVLM